MMKDDDDDDDDDDDADDDDETNIKTAKWALTRALLVVLRPVCQPGAPSGRLKPLRVVKTNL